jgi:hypothetical protein
VTLLALEKSGFPPGTDLNPGDMVAISGWMMSLAPFKGDGYREQATVWLERLEGHQYQVDVRVVRERNESLTNPLDPTVAKWKTDADNLQRARLVLQHIQSELGTDFEVGVKRSHEKFDKQ